MTPHPVAARFNGRAIQPFTQDPLSTCAPLHRTTAHDLSFKIGTAHTFESPDGRGPGSMLLRGIVKQRKTESKPHIWMTEIQGHFNRITGPDRVNQPKNGHRPSD